jgi:phosphoketolase
MVYKDIEMEDMNFGELKKLAEEVRDHSDKTVELFDEAHKLESEIAEVANTNQKRELMDKVRKINREAIAEAHKVIEIENELLLKEREELEKRLDAVQSIESASASPLKDNK